MAKEKNHINYLVRIELLENINLLNFPKDFLILLFKPLILHLEKDIVLKKWHFLV